MVVIVISVSVLLLFVEVFKYTIFFFISIISTCLFFFLSGIWSSVGWSSVRMAEKLITLYIVKYNLQIL